MPHSMWEKAKLYPQCGVRSGWLPDHRPTVLPCDISSAFAHQHCVKWSRLQGKSEGMNVPDGVRCTHVPVGGWVHQWTYF